MNSSVNPAPENRKKPRALSIRRAVLLATTIAGLGIGAFVVGPEHAYSEAALAHHMSHVRLP